MSGSNIGGTSPTQTLYRKAIHSPHTITRAERNQIQGRPPPSEEDALCLSATSHTFDGIVQKAIREPSTLTEIEARILSDGADQPSRTDIKATIAGTQAMQEEDRELMDQALKTSASPLETEAKIKAWEVLDRLRVEKRAVARQQREAARSAPNPDRGYVLSKKPWVTKLEQSQWTDWGFVCYRTSYSDEEAWTKVKERMSQITAAALAPMCAVDVVKQTWRLHFVEDETLEGMNAEGLRENFKDLSAIGNLSEGIRKDYFVSADDKVVRSFQLEDSTPVIPVWDAGFDSPQTHADGYPGAVAVPSSMLFTTVYPMMLMGEPTPLQTLHMMAGG